MKRYNYTLKKHKKQMTRKKKTKNRHSISYNTKHNFVKKLIQEWKKQTRGGCVEKDQTTIYINDYYLSLTKKCDYYNHIHLILHNFDKTHDNHNNIIYLLKKRLSNRVIHSNVFRISIFSVPAIIVKHMIKHYYDFVHNI